MSTPSLTEFRELASDTPIANLARKETPDGPNDGVNTFFRLQNYPIVSGSVFLTIGSTVRTQAGFTVDNVNGLITFTVAPAASSNPFFVDYNFNWFNDTDTQQFIDEGTRALGFPAGSTTVDEGLLPALYQYALYFFWMRRATIYANRYSSTGGMAGHSVDVVTKAYRELGVEAYKSGEILKTEFYKRQGRREAPTSSTFAYGFDPYTPIR